MPYRPLSKSKSSQSTVHILERDFIWESFYKIDFFQFLLLFPDINSQWHFLFQKIVVFVSHAKIFFGNTGWILRILHSSLKSPNAATKCIWVHACTCVAFISIRWQESWEIEYSKQTKNKFKARSLNKIPSTWRCLNWMKCCGSNNSGVLITRMIISRQRRY